MKDKETSSLVIEKHNFQTAIDSLKKYETLSNYELKSAEKIRERGGLFNLGNHKVTGAEFKNTIGEIQTALIQLKTVNMNLASEFGQVYKAFESLDKDYISGIVGAIKAAEKVSEEERKDRADIKKIIERLNKSIEVLSKFKTDIDKLKHIADIDKAWELIENQQETCASLKEESSELWKAANQFTDLISGVQFSVEEINATIVKQQQAQKDFETKIKKELLDYGNSVEQKLSVQAEVIKNHKDDLDAALNRTCSELNQRFEILTEQSERQIDSAIDIQNAMIEHFTQEQTSAFDAMQKTQEERITTLTLSQEKQLSAMANTIEAEKSALKDTICLLKRKLKIAYIVVGSAFTLAAIDFALSIFGVL